MSRIDISRIDLGREKQRHLIRVRRDGRCVVDEVIFASEAESYVKAVRRACQLESGSSLELWSMFYGVRLFQRAT